MREAIKSEIKSLLKNKNNPTCVLLKGDWGIGKTHIWKEIEKELRSENNAKTLIAYVSLFGKENIAQIEQEIKSQISVMPEIKEKFKKTKEIIDKIPFELIPIIGNLTPVVTTSLNGLLYILGKEIKKVIICFDDFERHSKKLEFKDILGEISVLKENNNCNILMIMNENELEKSDKSKEEEKNKKLDGDIFDEYKEKIVDCEFTYEPMPQDSFEAIKDNFGDFKDIASEYFKNSSYTKTNNIRTIKKIAHTVNNISQHITNFNELEYEIRKDFFDTIGNTVADYTENLLMYPYPDYFSIKFRQYVKKYLQHNIANIDFLDLNNEIKIATEKYNIIQKNNEMIELKINLKEFYLYYKNDFPLDFTNDYEWAINKISEFLHNKYFIDVVEYDEGLRWLNKLYALERKLNTTDRHDELKLKLLKEYCKINKQDEKALSIIINFDKSNSQILYDEIIKDNVDNVVEFKTAEKLCEYLNITGKDDEYSMLKFVDTNKLKEFFTQSLDSVRICVNEIERYTRFEEMNKFKEKIIDVLGDIATDNKLEKFQNEKAKKILKNLKIKQLDEPLKIKIEDILKEIEQNIDNNQS
ncbi:MULTISPECIES: P-loop NTPase fold protein [unclassified Campylobacter]|uniref:P-loop NTPase fold protein n=1 Tax=unclassified Campylobacter TaxID=2593542 RepID=UPI0022E9FCBC|nr:MULTISPECIES: P-loop NTPase fold protein [unclassified Campylobacter]MDA3080106.1 KAP family NTPase [Campylobacter sp. CS_NA2]MDA3081673.1 KAP family NTPase [Campylobacter sp. CS_NA1]MDA3086163.1 KAP family NTPase [Campylobacter sp. CS_ED1]MDA3090888.1 KAP family NTPase [Campylobacter sp. CS_ED2]WBR51158.1 P-loop NTPase fold protein [Campylobacter sp. CS_NA3]